MIARPYIGITGIVTSDDAETARECVRLVPPTHRLMAGVLVSAKTLRGGTPTSRRYPRIGAVEGILAALADAGAWPVVHYNSRAEGEDLAVELRVLANLCESMRGVQLNIARPDAWAIDGFLRGHPNVEFILQVNRGAYPNGVMPSADVAAAYVHNYRAVASYALLDLSGGLGTAVDVEFTAKILSRWREDWFVGAAVAGGLGPDASGVLTSLRGAVGDGVFRTLSFDAETGVRVPVSDPIAGEKHQDTLARGEALAWVRCGTAAILGQNPADAA